MYIKEVFPNPITIQQDNKINVLKDYLQNDSAFFSVNTESSKLMQERDIAISMYHSSLYKARSNPLQLIPPQRHYRGQCEATVTFYVESDGEIYVHIKPYARMQF